MSVSPPEPRVVAERAARAPGPAAVDRDELEASVAAELTALVGQRPSAVLCPTVLPTVVGQTSRCHVRTPDGTTLGATVTVTAVRGDRAHFDVAVDDGPGGSVGTGPDDEQRIDDGREPRALATAEDTVERLRAQRGADDVDTLRGAHELASALCAHGEHARARALEEDTLLRRRWILGDDHPETLASALALARTLRPLGSLLGAYALDRDALPRARRVLGDDHPVTRALARNLDLDLNTLAHVTGDPRLRPTH